MRKLTNHEITLILLAVFAGAGGMAVISYWILHGAVNQFNATITTYEARENSTMATAFYLGKICQWHASHENESKNMIGSCEKLEEYLRPYLKLPLPTNESGYGD